MTTLTKEQAEPLLEKSFQRLLDAIDDEKNSEGSIDRFKKKKNAYFRVFVCVSLLVA